MRIRARRFPRAHTKELGVKSCDIVQEPARERVRLPRPPRMRIPVPPAVESIRRSITNQLATLRQRYPQLVEVTNPARKAAGNAHDRDLIGHDRHAVAQPNHQTSKHPDIHPTEE